MAERLFILDAHSLIYQLFHAIPEMTAPDGRPTNAVFGFVRDIEFVRKMKKPDYFVCAMDASSQTFRHDLFTDYKANRAEMPDDLRPQIETIRRVLSAYRIPILSQEGIEADDFLATVALEGKRRKVGVFLCTADKDLRQCVGDGVVMYDLRRNRVIDPDYVVQDWGVTPEQVIDFQAMVGDSTDNVPGVPGVGPKTASKLLVEYGTLEGVYEHLDEIKGKLRENLEKGKESAFISRELVRLKSDVEIPDDWATWRLHPPNRPELLALFQECGFHRFADDLRVETLPSTPTEWSADYRLVKDESAFESFLAELKQQKRISFDLETTSIHPTQADIVGYAISWTPGVAYYIAVRGPLRQTELDPARVLDRLRSIIEDPSVEKVGQNLKYDIIALRRVGVHLQGLAFDTMLASYLLEPGERNHNLDELAERLLDHRNISITELIGKGKNQLRMDQVEIAAVAQYAGEDADVALKLTEILEPRLQQEGLAPLMEDVELPLVDVLADMEATGIRVDTNMLAELSVEFGKKIDALRGRIHQSAGRTFNIDSVPQLRTVLFEELKLPILKRTKMGPSTDQEVLEELAEKHEICALIVEYRQWSKLKGTYLDSLPELMNPETGRIHASFNQTVAATGRLSSSDPNLQNIPIRSGDGEKIRRAFLPGTEGQQLLSADYSQIELRLLAYYSGDAILKKSFEEDKDIHAVVGAQIGGVALEEVTSDLRRKAKAVNFGIMYGLSPFGLARQLKIDEDEAATFIDAYFQQYPGIEDFFTRVLTDAKKNRYVATILGRKRPITGIKNTTGRVRNLPERTAINTVIQGSAADLIKTAMLHIHRRLTAEHPKAKLLLQIHDELVFEAERAEIADVARLVEHEMVHAIPFEGVRLKVDVGVGPNWLDLEPLPGDPR